jgi:hypothetical protein
VLSECTRWSMCDVSCFAAAFDSSGSHTRQWHSEPCPAVKVDFGLHHQGLHHPPNCCIKASLPSLGNLGPLLRVVSLVFGRDWYLLGWAWLSSTGEGRKQGWLAGWLAGCFWVQEAYAGCQPRWRGRWLLLVLTVDPETCSRVEF